MAQNKRSKRQLAIQSIFKNIDTFMNSLTPQELECFKNEFTTTAENIQNILNHPIMKLIMIEQPEAVQNVKLDWFNRRDGVDGVHDDNDEFCLNVASRAIYKKELINIDANRETFINSFTAALIEQMQNYIT